MHYDAYLSYSSADRDAVRVIANWLRAAEVRAFFDLRDLPADTPWMGGAESALDASRAFVVFLGPGPAQPWARPEAQTVLALAAKDASRRVIPVLLPGAEEVPAPSPDALPAIDLRGTNGNGAALGRLVDAIIA